MTQTITPNALLLKHPAHFFSLGFGSGLSPKAPGTCGTLAALPFLLLLWRLPSAAMVAVIVIGFIAGIWCTEKTAKAMTVDDPGAIVWDEFIGLFISGLPFWLLSPEMQLLVLSSPWLTFIALLGTFTCFRVFDIAKPFPISWADARFHGGFGIMFDDVLAGIIAALCLIWPMRLFFV